MAYYDQIAEGYNELHGEEQRKKLKIVKKHFKPKGLILDIGAGTGIAEKYFDNIVMMDPSKELLKKAKGKTVVGKAEKIPFPDKTFDAIISITALHHTDIDKAIKEIKRVSKENCIYAFTILKKAKNHDKIVEELKKNFKFSKEINEEKDTILIS
ncbi:MAG: class I SAM-dependent methyltransferase [Nanoarchaeota archaeon]|nr:class I SAM-dependent methyltransferase [Nanoarchaeota archaeon]MCG2718299.1 class I SAM-dependent methyltransferase [Nanoarchaeota archaeon]